MHHTKTNPAALAGAHRAVNLDAFLTRFDCQPNALFQGGSLAFLHLARRYRLAIPTTRTTAQLSGMGAGHD
jgi:hypothetical protein